MPVTQDFYISHQWLRELKRRGIRTLVGVYFKLNSSELVWYAKYNEAHKKVELGNALSEFLKTDDKMGFEFILDRKVEAKEIGKIKQLPQNIGWRYKPDSHASGLSCACPMCITPGETNSSKKRKRIEQREDSRL